ncbi:serine/threonine protein kinase [Pseudarthrobacter sp. P1]|uniref:serine/threonine protein kinase n=1 Tax=Pseudarthrobacter sp. P1 TaxID=3418418 RepID=UPI003CED2491
MLSAACPPPPPAGLGPPAGAGLPGAGHSAGGGSGWERELRILSRYRHEHLLAMHGVAALAGPWQGGRALLMECAAGGSLAEVVAARGALGVGECVTVLTPLAQVLGYLHGEGVWHGDVSPANMLFTAHGKPVLADFGLGRLLGESGAAVLGTAGFASASEVRLSAAADVRAAAALGWYALTGQVPAPALDRPPLPMLVPGVPAELAAALEAALREDPAQRPTALELAQAVYRSAPAEPVDLALAVHPSVLPELLTRRAAVPARSQWSGAEPGWWPRLRSGAAGWIRRRRGRPEAWRRVPWHDSSASAAPQPAPPVPGARPGPASRPAANVLAAAGLGRGGAAGHRWAVPGTVPATGTTRNVPAATRNGTRAGHPPRARSGRWTAFSAAVPAADRQRHRWLRPAAAGAVVLLGLGAGLLSWRPGGPADARMPDGPAAAAVPADPLAAAALPDAVRGQLAAGDPAQALAGLSWLRSYALGSGQPELLAWVDTDGSPALAADAAVANALAAAGHSFSGLETTVVQASAVAAAGPEPGGGRAVVDAVVATGPFIELDAAARVVSTHQESASQYLRFVLVDRRG